MDLIKLTIDGKDVKVPKGETIYKAAKTIGIDIPVLCYMDLKDLHIENKPGGCRICSVEVEGRRNLAPSCSTEVSEGMVVRTSSVRVLNARRTVMELILSDHPKDCLICAKSGKCDLQDMSIRLGVRNIPGQDFAEMSVYRTDTSPSIIRDMDKCIMCRRCETMCNDFQTVGALNAVNRGFQAVVAPAFEMNLEHSSMYLLRTMCGRMSDRCTYRS